MSEPVPALPGPTAPPQLTVEDVIRSQAGPIVTQLTTQAVGSLKTDVDNLFGNHQDNARRIAALEANLSSAASTIETRIETDVWLQRCVVLLVVGGAILLATVILIADFAGSHAAADMVAGAWALFGSAAVAAVYHMIGAPGSAKPVVPVNPPAPVTATATATA